jgi:hypothetical protein
MKKTFLKTLVATAIVGATVALSSALAFAGSITWNYEDTATVPAEFGFVDADGASTLNATATAGTSRKGYFTENIFSDGTGKIAGHTGYDPNKNVATDLHKANEGRDALTTKYAGFTPTKTGTIKFYIISNNSSDKDDAIRFYHANTDEKVAAGHYVIGDQIGDVHALKNRDYETAGVDAIELPVTAGNRYVLYGNTSTILVRMQFDYDDDDTETSEVGLTTVTNGAVYVTDTDTYVIAGVSKDDINNGDVVNVTIGNTVVSAGSTVYQNVDINDTTTVTNTQVGADYIVAVKVAGANKDARVEGFTVAVEAADTDAE